MDFHRVCSISLVRGGKNSKRHINLALDFRQALIQGFPLIGVKKAHTLPHQSHVMAVILRTSIRLDVQM